MKTTTLTLIASFLMTTNSYANQISLNQFIKKSSTVVENCTEDVCKRPYSVKTIELGDMNTNPLLSEFYKIADKNTENWWSLFNKKEYIPSLDGIKVNQIELFSDGKFSFYRISYWMDVTWKTGSDCNLNITTNLYEGDDCKAGEMFEKAIISLDLKTVYVHDNDSVEYSD